MMQRCSIRPPSIAPLILAFALAGGAGAQTSRPQLPPASPPSDHLLAGPRVQEQPEDGPGPRFNGARRGRRPALQVNRWMAVYRSLDLDPDQRARARQIARELERARKAFQREHGKDQQRLQEGMQALDPADRRRLEELRERQPQVEATMLGLWQLLNPRQQEEMRKELRKKKQKGTEARRHEGTK
jgi:hypothetical protein